MNESIKVSCRQTDSEILKNWLDNTVSRATYSDVKKRLAKECLVPMSTFRNWIYGRGRITNAAKRDINRVTMEISGQEIFTIVYPEGADEGVSVNTSGETI